jgi:hypothetical protein
MTSKLLGLDRFLPIVNALMSVSLNVGRLLTTSRCPLHWLNLRDLQVEGRA